MEVDVEVERRGWNGVGVGVEELGCWLLLNVQGRGRESIPALPFQFRFNSNSKEEAKKMLHIPGSWCQHNMCWRWEGRTAQTRVCGVYYGLLREEDRARREEVGSTVDGAGAPWSNWRRFLGLLMCVMSCGTLATGRYSNEKPPTRSESWQETNQGTILALALIDSGPCPSSSPLSEETKKQTELHVLLFYFSLLLPLDLASVSVASFPSVDLDAIPRLLPGWLHGASIMQH